MDTNIIAEQDTIERVALTFVRDYPQYAMVAGQRIQKAITLASLGFVHRTETSGVFFVRSQSPRAAAGVGYFVRRGRSVCTCEDAARGHTCKHYLAAFLAERAESLDADRQILEDRLTAAEIAEEEEESFEDACDSYARLEKEYSKEDCPYKNQKDMCEDCEDCHDYMAAQC